ncbi:hypothetical protein [Rhizobium sp. C4]|uniref:hypothetical protein n=1 Tax=Rhizobium sp. C4 TaxID=1349800 RepID=UPI001E4A4028|nr:hypothetical protein [Rhizobium sp. C4]MCD2175303.1 hypothetical protein [Rhizobium sp. C4]
MSGRLGSKRQWTELDLVASTGVGMEPIASDLCRILRHLVNADAGAIFWMGDNGLPSGFFHEDSDASVRDLFANAYEELFIGDWEVNVASLIARTDFDCGHLIAPPSQYWKSNTYNLLVRASGHHHTIDLRVDEGGRARAVVLLFRSARRSAFDEDDRDRLRLALPALRRALHTPSDATRWMAKGAPAYVIVDGTGSTLLFASETAASSLQKGNLVAQGVPQTGRLVSPPAFAGTLCRRLANELRPGLRLPVPEGRLNVSAERLERAGAESAVLLTIQHEEPDRIAVVRRVLALDISPRQKSLVLAAASGASRMEAAAQTNTSAEAMKKHLATIYEATGARSWTDLSRAFAPG